MTIYLLGTQCLFDIAKKDGNEAEVWYNSLALRGLYLGDVRISAFSVAYLRFYFDQHPSLTRGDRQLKKNVEALIDKFKNAGAVMGCPPQAAYYWAERLGYTVTYDRPPPPREIPFEEVIVVATAAASPNGNSYVLVDRRQTVHEDLKIPVHDPY
jgi:hypothetical protein